MTNETLERQILDLVAVDRFHIVASSMDGKLKRRKDKAAESLDLPKGRYSGERVYARIEVEDKLKSKRMADAVAEYCETYPAQGKILTQMIEDQRSVSETHLYFGVNEGCRLTADDYLGVMSDLGFTEKQASDLYEPLINSSRAIAKKRDEERSVMID
jgi:hypothetical protein